MKKIVFQSMIFAFAFILVKCEYNNIVSDEKQQITFIKTNPGGCNTQGEEDTKRFFLGNDTIVFGIENDTLELFIGLNYICCAPFTTETIVSNDSVFIAINDTCPVPYQSCYCKCMCNYTWEFLFSVRGEKKYWIEILLNDPRLQSPVIVHKGWNDLN